MDTVSTTPLNTKKNTTLSQPEKKRCRDSKPIQNDCGTDRSIHGLTAIWRKLLELLKNLASSLLLILCQVFPGFHPTQHALLLLRRQAGKMPQSLQQTGLLGRREPAELGIVFKRALLLRGR